jgi:hypothetical protein
MQGHQICRRHRDAGKAPRSTNSGLRDSCVLDACCRLWKLRTRLGHAHPHCGRNTHVAASNDGIGANSDSATNNGGATIADGGTHDDTNFANDAAHSHTSS